MNNPAHRPRALDWFCAAMMILWGVAMLLPGMTFGRNPAYVDILRGIDEDVWANVLLVFGGLRIAGLIINGRAHEGSPVLRLLSAMVGTIVWVQFVIAFTAISMNVGAVTIGLPMCLGLAGADLYSCARSGYDVVRAARVRMAAKLRQPRAVANN